MTSRNVAIRAAIVISVGLSFAFSCGRGGGRARENPPPIAGATVGSAYKSIIGKAVAPDTVWPIPAGASRLTSGTATKVVQKGTGENVVLNANHVLGISFVEYDKQGRVIHHAPFRVQAIDVAPQPWREVLLQMTNREVRRAWIPQPDNSVVIMDFEIQQHVKPTAADYGR